MTLPYPKDSYITHGTQRRKVLEVLGDLRFISAPEGTEFWETHSGGCSPLTVQQLANEGWVEEPVKKKKWEPRKRDRYWYIDSDGDVCDSNWLDYLSDTERRDFLGVYEKEDDARAAVARIKEAIKDIV